MNPYQRLKQKAKEIADSVYSPKVQRFRFINPKEHGLEWKELAGEIYAADRLGNYVRVVVDKGVIHFEFVSKPVDRGWMF